MAKTLLNNLDYVTQQGGFPVEKVYSRLAKHNVLIPSFGKMLLDGPISDLDLPQLELMFHTHPDLLLDKFGISCESIQALKIPHIMDGDPSSHRSEQKQNMLTLSSAALFLTVQFMASYAVIANLADPSSATASAAAAASFPSTYTELINSLHIPIETLAFMTLCGIMDSPFLFNGLFARKAQWIASSLAYHFHSQEKARCIRHTAATFVVAYLLGVPIQSLSLDPKEEVRTQ